MKKNFKLLSLLLVASTLVSCGEISKETLLKEVGETDIYEISNDRITYVSYTINIAVGQFLTKTPTIYVLSLSLDKENPSMFSVAAHQKDSSSFQCLVADSSITYLKFNESTNKYEYRHDNETEQIDDKESAWAIVKDQIDKFSQSHDYRTYEVSHYRNMQYEKLDAKITRKDDGYLATYQAKDESSNQGETIWDYSVDINKKGFITKNFFKSRSYTSDDPRPIFIWNEIYCIDYSGKYTVNSSDEDYLETAVRFVEETQIENYWATFKKQGLI